MPVLAVAFHHDFALERLYEYFANPEAQRRATTQSCVCSKCGLVFAIVLTQKSDPRNDASFGVLCERIAEGCDVGIHEDEYVLDAP
jgi:hypothetical protein